MCYGKGQNPIPEDLEAHTSLSQGGFANAETILMHLAWSAKCIKDSFSKCQVSKDLEDSVSGKTG